jgi:hypothetical protein
VRWENGLVKLRADLFGKWSPYPARTLADLSPAQREVEALQLDAAPFWRWSPEKIAHEARRLGRVPSGSADVVLALDPPRALWAAVNDVAAQLREPGPVIEAFRTLAPDLALDAWRELARGVHEVDVDRAKEWKFAGDGGVRPFNVAFRERFADLLAQFSLHLGARGEEAAAAWGSELLAQGRSLQQLKSHAVASHVLASHASARGVAPDARWDPLFASTLGSGQSPAIAARLRVTLGADRVARLPPMP